MSITHDTKPLCRIAVDYENVADSWWEAAYDALNSDSTVREKIPAEALKIFDSGVEEVYVSPEAAEAFEAWASKLPGWDDGPEYARYPLTILYEKEEVEV